MPRAVILLMWTQNIPALCYTTPKHLPKDQLARGRDEKAEFLKVSGWTKVSRIDGPLSKGTFQSHLTAEAHASRTSQLQIKKQTNNNNKKASARIKPGGGGARF